MRIFRRWFGKIRLQTACLSLAPPAMFLVASLFFSPEFIANLNATTVGLNNCDSTTPIVLRSRVWLTIALFGQARFAVTVDAFGLLIQSFVTDPDCNALALLGRHCQLGKVIKILSSFFVRAIAGRCNGNFFQHRRCLGLIDITPQNSELREKNRGGKPRSVRLLF